MVCTARALSRLVRRRVMPAAVASTSTSLRRNRSWHELGTSCLAWLVTGSGKPRIDCLRDDLPDGYTNARARHDSSLFPASPGADAYSKIARSSDDDRGVSQCRARLPCASTSVGSAP